MSEETEEVQKVPYTVEDFTNGEVGELRRVLTSEGRVLFIVPNSFTDDQIELTYQLCDEYFKQGMEYGVSRVQDDLHKILGLSKPREESQEEIQD